MKLSKRLKTICEFVPNNAKIIDVGADHALVDIYLAKEKNCKCLATDISSNCIEKAKENIKKYNATVKTKVADGLNGINITDEIILISGMGTHSILKILNKNIKNDLIISSHNDIPRLRKNLQERGYRIKNETVIYDKHFYIITYYEYKKHKKQNNYITDFIKDKEYIQYLLNKYKIKYKNEKNIIKKLNYYKIINKLNKRSTKM